MKQIGYKSAYIFGAVNALSGDKCGLIVPNVNTETMNFFLQRVSKKMSRWKHCILIVDGAGWHRSEEIIIPKNITLLSLPPYSPQLNGIERLWLWLKDNFLSNSVFENEKSIYKAGMDAWNKATAEIIQSLCHKDFLTCL